MTQRLNKGIVDFSNEPDDAQDEIASSHIVANDVIKKVMAIVLVGL